jgi:dolichyl-phosphate-mannose-protein mannosyltransferase
MSSTSAEENPALSRLAERSRRGLYALSVLLLFGVFAFQLWFHAVRTSATLDEPVHILAGHRYWQCRDFGINPEHPPFLKLLATASLNFRSLVEPPWECGSRVTSKPDSFLFGTKFLIQNDVDSVVVPARLAAALMSLFLAVLVFAGTLQMFGRWEALAALALLSFEPNLIAHGALVMTDMALAATAFAAVYALYGFCRKSNARRFAATGLAFGLLLAAKHSAVIFMPILFGLLIADALVFQRAETRLSKQIFRRTVAFAGMFLIGLAMLWAFYGFRYYSIPGASARTVSVADYIRANGRPETVDSLSAKIVTGVNQTRIFPESYVLGLADIVATGSRNMTLLGRAYPRGKWFYFPIAFLVKSSVALLVLLPLGLLFPFFNAEKRRELTFLLAPPLVFFAVALTSGINISVRHILPVYPFFIIAAAVGAVWLSRKFNSFRYVLIGLLIFHAVTAARIAPHYIAFANDFWGGSDNAYRIFRDSNLDMGQNDKFVKEYLTSANIKDCWFAPHGNVELVAASQPCRLLPGSFRLSVSDKLEEPVPPVIEGTVLLTAMVLPPRGGAEYLPILQNQPIARIGKSIFVYQGRFEVPLAAALSHAERANRLIILNRFEEAVADGRTAVELAPNDPRTHLALGLALVRNAQTGEARREFGTAVELAKSNPAFRNQEVRARQELERLN